MSKNNVNPDHYKVAGRERPGKAAAQVNSMRVPRERAHAGERWAPPRAGASKGKGKS